MKTKRTMLIILAALMLMSLMLIGCRDRNNQQPDDPFAPPIQDAPRRPGTVPDDPNRPMPQRNPDGTIG